ncbi:MAG: LPS export ABC transporter permease LptF [Gammaproteobacteria bacterium]|nr:LPS export ABC transporter permease LptF [Gammaproteobacteria bacterium]
MILQRYLQRETLQAFGASLLVLVLIYSSTRTVSYLGDAASGKIASDVIVSLLGLKIITAMLVVLPLCFYLGVLLALGRMQQDRELVAMAGAGCGARFFHTHVGRAAIACAALMALLSFVTVPWAERRVETLQARASDEANVSGIVPGRFKEFEGGDRVLFVENASATGEIMRNVFLRVREHEREGVLKADSARLDDDAKTGGRFVVFGDGSRYLGLPGQADYRITDFEKYAVRISAGKVATADPAMGATPTHELWLLGTAHAVAELNWRLAMPIAVVLLGALAVALVRMRTFAGARSMLILVGIMIYFLYSNLLGIFRSLVKREIIDGLVGMWPVHGMLVIVILGIELGPRLWRRRQRPDVQLLPSLPPRGT